MFLTELHCHTAEGSLCARENAADTVEKYIAAGYSTVVLTNHINSETYELYGTDDHAGFAERYIAAYREMKEYAGERLNVLFGCELCFNGVDHNDYLVYGMTEDFLMSHPGIVDSRIGDFYPLAHENGMLVFQAHPFRNGMNLAKPENIDGIEVFNGNVWADSHNDIADMWANSLGLKKTAGSDHHDRTDEASCGILTDMPIKTNADLVAVLKSEQYLLKKTVIPGMSRPM